MPAIEDNIRILCEADPVRAEEALRHLQEVGPSCLAPALPKEGSFALHAGSRYRRCISRLCTHFSEATLLHVADVLEHGGYHEQTLAIAALEGLHYDLYSPACSRIARLLNHRDVDVQAAAITGKS